MHLLFADWYKPAQFNADEEVLAKRWQGIKQLYENSPREFLDDLVRFVFTGEMEEEHSTNFKNTFKKLDANFLMSDNNNELLVLAGCVLAYVIYDELKDFETIATEILSASLFNAREQKSGIDLEGIANSIISKAAIINRERPKIEKLKIKPLSKAAIVAKIKKVEQDQSWESVSEGLNGVVEFVSESRKSFQTEINVHLKPILDFISIQDEELEVLWWQVNGWSNIANQPFEKVSKNSKALIFGKETARLVECKIELPNLVGIFSKLGIANSGEISISEAINECGVEILKKMSDKNYCKLLTPIHAAANRATETDCGDEWILGWTKLCGFSNERKLSPIDIAIQFHRESLIKRKIFPLNSDE